MCIAAHARDMGHLVATPALLFLLIACGAETVASTPGSTPAPRVDLSPSLAGVPDRADDPAVVALDIAGRGVVCTGVLLSADVVLTSSGCAPPSPQGLRVLVGDSIASAVERARGLQVLAPALGGSDLALVALDATIDDIAPLAVRATGAATGDHVRTVGFTLSGRIVRDHVPLLGSNEGAFLVEEKACVVGEGAAALDESTGEVLGVLTSGATTGCAPDADREAYARTDVVLPLLAEALAVDGRSVTKGAQKTKKGPIDMGAGCSLGADCAAGACATYAGAQYCSRTCDAQDRCPAHFKCMGTQPQTQQAQQKQPSMVCVEN
jgi:hypothetical protein